MGLRPPAATFQGVARCGVGFLVKVSSTVYTLWRFAAEPSLVACENGPGICMYAPDMSVPGVCQVCNNVTAGMARRRIKDDFLVHLRCMCLGTMEVVTFP